MIKKEEVYKIGASGSRMAYTESCSCSSPMTFFDVVDADYLILDIDGILIPFFIEEYRFRSD